MGVLRSPQLKVSFHMDHVHREDFRPQTVDMAAMLLLFKLFFSNRCFIFHFEQQLVCKSLSCWSHVVVAFSYS